MLSGGWNNNPNVQHFKSTFRKLVMHSGAMPGTTGNIQKMDSTDIISCSTLSSDLITGDVTDDPFCAHDQIVLEHDYAAWTHTTNKILLDNATTYIAGWVIRKVVPKLRCDDCRAALVCTVVPGHTKRIYHLLTLKNNGGLVVPSTGAASIVHLAEKCIQRLMNIHSVKNICSFTRVLMMVREMVGERDILDMRVHIIDTQHGIDNHFTTLLSALVETYYNLRQHHIAKMYNIKKTRLHLSDK